MTEQSTASTKPSLAEQAARASVMAPVIAIGLNIFLKIAGIEDGTAGALIVSFAAIGLFLAGFVCAIVGLVGIRKHGRKGILVRSIVGLLFNGIIICAMVSVFMALRAMAKENRESGRERTLEQIEQEEMDSFLNYPGWYGIAEVEDTVLVAVSLDDQSPTAKMLNSDVGVDVSIAQVTIINQSLYESVTVDSAHAVLTLRDGAEVPCLPLADVLRSAREEKNEMLAKFLGPHTVAPQTQISHVFLYTRHGFPWENVDAITITFGGEPLMIEGDMLTAARKREMYEEGLRAQALQQQ